MTENKCPKCGETENLHYNYDWSDPKKTITYGTVLCNECGEFFEEQDTEPTEFQTKPGFVERRMALGKLNNDKLWDEIYSEYSNEQYPPFGGPFTNALSFIDWLKQNYISPNKIK